MTAILKKGISAQQSGTFILAIAFLLALLGLLNVLSATLVKALDQGYVLSTSFVKQSVALMISAMVCRCVAVTDYHKIVRWAPRLLVATWIGLVLVLFVGTKMHGARRWIPLGFFSLQVSEVAKFAVVVFAAHYASVRGSLLHDYKRGFLPAAGCLAVTVLLVAKEPDFGTSMFLMVIGFIVLFLGGMRLRHILISAAVALPPFVLIMLQKFGHIQERLNTLRDGVHPQVQSALNAMGAGGVVGTGVGLGKSQLKFLPFIESDFVFASVGEQLGFLGALGVIVLFLLFFWHGMKIAFRAPDKSGFLIAFGLTFTVVFQAGINMAVVTGLVPPKGIGLPFVSYGGSSLLMLGVAVGVLYNVASQGQDTPLTDEEVEESEEDIEESGLLIPGLDID